ncbi:protein-export chaperone SecB [Flavobacteriaceae bacterium]|nr:protein-export chaperone SecB [Flavobacteriaceae bacterium]
MSNNVKIVRQFLRKLDFNLQKPFLDKGENPNVEMSIDIDAGKIAEDSYEISLKIKSTAKEVFSCDVHYCGIFNINDFPSNEGKEQTLLAYCPTILFPFIRQIIHNTTAIGLPFPIMLDPIDFYALHEKRKLQINKTAH